MHNAITKSIFWITNLIYFRDLKKHILINVITNNLMKKQFCKKKKIPIYVKLGLMDWDLIYMYEFDKAINFKLKSISLFWYLDNFLKKDKSGLLFQINIAWSVFTGLINWIFLIFEPFIYIEPKCLYHVYCISSDFTLFFFICQGLCWMRCLCISFTCSCFLFPVGGGGGGGGEWKV